MFGKKYRSFPELVGRPAQQAAAYIASRGLQPVILRPNDPMTMDLRMDRVRIIIDPTRNIVIRTPVVGLTFVILKPNAPMTMDYRTDCVIILVDASRNVVI